MEITGHEVIANFYNLLYEKKFINITLSEWINVIHWDLFILMMSEVKEARNFKKYILITQGH